MVYVRPDFYDDFSCLAGGCVHSCCRGWEIDIDDEALARWSRIGGELGAWLAAHIERKPTPHFILDEQERCPLLREDGLCRLILEQGEDSLCDICASHPRFYNEFDGRMEMGLGLCCEEAARLLLAGRDHLRLLTEDDGADPCPPEPIFEAREAVFRCLRRDELPLAERMREALAAYGLTLTPFDRANMARLYLSLERMDAAWTELLERLAADAAPAPVPEGMAWARLAEYFVYRHFAAAQSRAEEGRRLRFCFRSVQMIAALSAYVPIAEAARLYSAEIEYSDENVDRLLEELE